MIITHASAIKIDKVENYFGPLRGCLCFGDEGNTYNLAGECNYQYSLKIDEDNILRITSLFFHHEVSEFSELFENLADELGLDVESDSALLEELLDDTTFAHDHADRFENCGDAAWLVQQYQGLIAAHLGYEAALASDEQGDVYIVDCRSRKLH